MTGDDGKKEIPGFDVVDKLLERFQGTYDRELHEGLVRIAMWQYERTGLNPEDGAVEFHTRLKPLMEKDIEGLDETAQEQIREAFDASTEKGRGFYQATRGGKAPTDGQSMDQLLSGVFAPPVEGVKLPSPPEVKLPGEEDVDGLVASIEQEMDDVTPEVLIPQEPAPLTPTALPPKPDPKPKSTKFSEGETYRTPGQPPAQPPIDFPEPTAEEPAPDTLVAQVPQEPAPVKPASILQAPQPEPEPVIPSEPLGLAPQHPKPSTTHIAVPPPVDEEVVIPPTASGRVPIVQEPSVVVPDMEGVSTRAPGSLPEDTEPRLDTYLAGNVPPPAPKPENKKPSIRVSRAYDKIPDSFWTTGGGRFFPNRIRYWRINSNHGYDIRKRVKENDERKGLEAYFRKTWGIVQEYITNETLNWAERGIIKVEHVSIKSESDVGVEGKGIDSLIGGSMSDIEEKERLEKEEKLLEHTIASVSLEEFLKQDNETLLGIKKAVKRVRKTRKPHRVRRTLCWLTFAGVMTAAGIAVQYYAVKDLLFKSLDESVAAGQLTSEQGSNLKNVFYVKTKGVNTLKAYPVANGMQDEISQLERINENMAKLDSLMGVANEYGKRPDVPEEFSEELKKFNPEYDKVKADYANMNVALVIDPEYSATGPTSEYLKKLGDDLENKVVTANRILLLYDAKEKECDEKPEEEKIEPEPIPEPKPQGIVGRRRRTRRQTEAKPASIEALEDLYKDKASLRDTSRK
jgi:hypothetical protein